MVASLNPGPSPPPTSGERCEGALFLSVAKCVIVGFGVALVGVAMCFPLFYILWGLRELGLLLAFFVIPVVAFFTRAFTREYLRRGTLGGAIALGLRYLLVGGWLGLVIKLFVVAGGISDTPFIVCIGGAIGTTIGSFAGAFAAGFAHQKACHCSRFA